MIIFACTYIINYKIYFTGIDDSETECNLDDVDIWDLKVINNNESIEYILEQILKLIN